MPSDKPVLVALDGGAMGDLFKEFLAEFRHELEIDEHWHGARIYGDITFDAPRGSLEFVSTSGGDFIRVDELDIRTDVNLNLEFKTPEIALPEYCVHVPCDGRVCTPRVVLVPSITVTVPLNLPPITSEVSGDGSIVPVHDAAEGLWKLKLQLNPLTADLDLIDVADTLGDLFESVMNEILSMIFGDTIASVIYAIIGEPVEWLLRTVLDVGDDLSEWFFRFLSDRIGLDDIFNEFLEWITGEIIIAEFEDVQTLFPAVQPVADYPAGLAAVKVRIEDVDIEVNDSKELIVGAAVGSP